jgi:hypothetical protein
MTWHSRTKTRRMRSPPKANNAFIYSNTYTNLEFIYIAFFSRDKCSFESREVQGGKCCFSTCYSRPNSHSRESVTGDPDVYSGRTKTRTQHGFGWGACGAIHHRDHPTLSRRFAKGRGPYLFIIINNNVINQRKIGESKGPHGVARTQTPQATNNKQNDGAAPPRAVAAARHSKPQNNRHRKHLRRRRGLSSGRCFARWTTRTSRHDSGGNYNCVQAAAAGNDYYGE